MLRRLRFIFFALPVLLTAQSPAPIGPDDVKLAPDSQAIGSGADLGAPYNLILDPSTGMPYNTYDQSANGWVIGAFGAAPSFVISGAEISGVITGPR